MILDETTMSSHYAYEANVGKLWNSTGSKVEMKLPRMAVVPLVLVHFLLEQPRPTNELRDKLAGEIVEPSTTGEHLRQEDCDMLLK